jgi:hypothetical protein
MSTFRFAAFGLGLAVVTAACSSTTTAEPAPPPPKPVCPNTVTAALDPKTTCQPEGYVCGIGYQCGAFQQQAACTCTKGVWACIDPATNPIVAGDDLSTHCVAEPPGTEKCPADVATVQAATPVDCTNSKKFSDPPCCTTAGKACYYTGATCTNGKVLTPPTGDECSCEQVGSFDGGVPYLAWVCTVAVCH